MMSYSSRARHPHASLSSPVLSAARTRGETEDDALDELVWTWVFPPAV